MPLQTQKTIIKLEAEQELQVNLLLTEKHVIINDEIKQEIYYDCKNTKIDNTFQDIPNRENDSTLVNYIAMTEVNQLKEIKEEIEYDFNNLQINNTFEDDPNLSENNFELINCITEVNCTKQNYNCDQYVKTNLTDENEEIDVVSIDEEQNIYKILKSGFTLPTNPANRNNQLERKVALANKHIILSNGGIKTTAHVKKRTKSRNKLKKRILETSHGVKRPKHYSRSNLRSRYKRRATQPSNSGDNESELEKRSLHNITERQRRIDLRNSFEHLRLLIPEVSSQKRTAKVVILREAALYSDELAEASESMYREVQQLLRQQEYLKARISQLHNRLIVY